MEIKLNKWQCSLPVSDKILYREWSILPKKLHSEQSLRSIKGLQSHPWMDNSSFKSNPSKVVCLIILWK